jgi:hypothetical protein
MLLDKNPYEITQSEGYCSRVNGMLLDINPEQYPSDCVISYGFMSSNIPFTLEQYPSDCVISYGFMSSNIPFTLEQYPSDCLIYEPIRDNTI